MMCNICGIEYDTPLMGGPGICPRCDCGNLETGSIKRQQERIAALEAENARLKTALHKIVNIRSSDGYAIDAQASARDALETSMNVGRPGGDKTCEVTYRQGPNGIVEILSEKCYEQKIKGEQG